MGRVNAVESSWDCSGRLQFDETGKDRRKTGARRGAEHPRSIEGKSSVADVLTVLARYRGN